MLTVRTKGIVRNTEYFLANINIKRYTFNTNICTGSMTVDHNLTSKTLLHQ